MQGIDILVEDVLNLIFGYITNQKDFFAIRLSYKHWAYCHKEYCIKKIHRELNVKYSSVLDLCMSKQAWIPYLGDYQLYADLARKVKTVRESDRLYVIHGFSDFTDSNSDFKQVKVGLKNFQTNAPRLEDPIILEREKKTLCQREQAGQRWSKFVILLPVNTKTLKDLSNCPTCGYICKHRCVNIGRNIVEREVIVNVKIPPFKYEELTPGGLETSYDNYVYLKLSEAAVKNIRDYIYAAKELGVQYFKYSTESEEIVFIV